ncbi:MAG TPA: mechanosensitive ion channel domain-containing protein [Verrucomicrobiae bacterium]|nr:mechanosensitive ion channel domain-containing protein [Verrucomicrobiae bacterium]
MTHDEILNLFTKPLFQLGQTWISMATMVEFVVVLLVVVLVSRVVRRLLHRRVLVHTKLDPGLQYAVARIISYVVLVLGLLIGLETLGINLNSLTVLAGALGVGIGFGLQNIVSNFVSGLILLTERPIEIGHRVDVGGTVGDIVRIGGRSTTIVTNDNITIIVPNSEFISGRVTNWSIGDPKVRFRVPVGVSYGSDPRLVEKLLLEAAAANPHVLIDPAPTVRFVEFGDSSLNFELRVWSIDMVTRPGALRSELNFTISDKFKEHGIEIPFPQRDVHVREPLRVEVKSS